MFIKDWQRYWSLEKLLLKCHFLSLTLPFIHKILKLSITDYLLELQPSLQCSLQIMPK